MPKFEFPKQTNFLKMRKITILAVAAALCLLPAQAVAGKKNKAPRVVPVVAQSAPQPVRLAITRPAAQLSGEWTVISMRNKPIQTRERAYLLLDFATGRLYGNNGCNIINGQFSQQAASLSFTNLVATGQSCHNNPSERTVMKALADVRAFDVDSLNHFRYLNLRDRKGQLIMTLRSQSLDFMNGAWRVKTLLGDSTVWSKNIRVVVDIDQRTINALTRDNVINGVVRVDASKPIDVQFEDLKSTNHPSTDCSTETQLLVCLEEMVACRVHELTDAKGNVTGQTPDERDLLDPSGQVLMVLKRIDLKQERQARLNEE